MTDEERKMEKTRAKRFWVMVTLARYGRVVAHAFDWLPSVMTGPSWARTRAFPFAQLSLFSCASPILPQRVLPPPFSLIRKRACLVLPHLEDVGTLRVVRGNGKKSQNYLARRAPRKPRQQLARWTTTAGWWGQGRRRRRRRQRQRDDDIMMVTPHHNVRRSLLSFKLRLVTFTAQHLAPKLRVMQKNPSKKR